MHSEYIKTILSKTKLSQQEAIWLLEHISGKKYPFFSDLKLTENQQRMLDDSIDQISIHHKPLAYVIGWVPFLDLSIAVKPPILIPRAETEEWVHSLIENIDPYGNQIHTILEIGTGSGAIGLSLAKHLPKAQILAIDINDQSIELAKSNAKKNNIQNITFLNSDLFEKIKDQKFDLIVSNPPYIPEDDASSINPSVINWEDPKALFSGKKGLDLLEKIVKESSSYILFNPSLPFQLVLEIDRTQNELLQKIGYESSWDCSIKKDLFGNWRTAWCKQK